MRASDLGLKVFCPPSSTRRSTAVSKDVLLEFRGLGSLGFRFSGHGHKLTAGLS